MTFTIVDPFFDCYCSLIAVPKPNTKPLQKPDAMAIYNQSPELTWAKMKG
jgi:hypothetical protein